MKKSLLLGLALMGGFCAYAQDVVDAIDVTPANYHFGTAESITLSPCFKNVNIGGPNTAWTLVKGDELYDQGLWTITTYAGGAELPVLETTAKTWSLVDFGGEVGQVAMYNGLNSNLKEKLMMARPDDDWSAIKVDENNPGACGFNLWLDPDAVFPGEDGYYFHAKIELMGYCNNPVSTDVMFNKVGGEAMSNDMRSFGAPGITYADFAETDEDGDPYYDEDGKNISQWDPTKWLVYEFDFSIGEATGFPARLRFEFPGTLGNKSVLIKDITITAIKDDAKATTCPNGDGNLEGANVTKSFNTYSSILDPIVNDNPSGIEAIGEEVNAPVEYYNLQGVKVVNPEKGIFIKKQGNKATKVVL